MDQNAGHIGGETAWKSERVVCVTPDHDDPDVRVGIRTIDSLGRCEGRGGAIERRAPPEYRSTLPLSSNRVGPWILLVDGDGAGAADCLARRALDRDRTLTHVGRMAPDFYVFYVRRGRRDVPPGSTL